MFNITPSIQILCKIPVCINFFRTLHNFLIKHKILELIDLADTRNTSTGIGLLPGILLTLFGLLGLGVTGIIAIFAWLALQFNPTGFVILFFAIITGIISIISLGSGITSLYINNPILAPKIIKNLFLISLIILFVIYSFIFL